MKKHEAIEFDPDDCRDFSRYDNALLQFIAPLMKLGISRMIWYAYRYPFICDAIDNGYITLEKDK